MYTGALSIEGRFYKVARNYVWRSRKRLCSELYLFVDEPATANERTNERPPLCDQPMWRTCQLMADSRTKMLSWWGFRDWCPVYRQILWSSGAVLASAHHHHAKIVLDAPRHIKPMNIEFINWNRCTTLPRPNSVSYTHLTLPTIYSV